MASGCILDTCPLCNELVWEDENIVLLENGVFVHAKCFKHVIKCPVCKIL